MTKLTLIALIVLVALMTHASAGKIKNKITEIKRETLYVALEADMRFNTDFSNVRIGCIMETVRTFNAGDSFDDLKEAANIANEVCAVYEFFLSPIVLCFLVIIIFVSAILCVAKFCCRIY